MVGVLLVAGVALILASAKGQAAPSSSSESTSPKDPPLPDSGGKLRMIPPPSRRAIGASAVSDSRYDGKGGVVAIGGVRGGPEGFPAPTYAGRREKQEPARAVSPDPAVAVMPPAGSRAMLPSRFRVPLPISTKGR